jgi:protocatechuate 3,4-dioxygenase beta subunit
VWSIASLAGAGWLTLGSGAALLAQRATPPPAEAGLRTFTVPKTASELEPASQPGDDVAAMQDRLAMPPAHDRLRTTVGVGYVQGADYGSELIADGTYAGWQVGLDSLFTEGPRGTMFDHGTLQLNDPVHGMHFEAGDVFSGVKGASRGARVTWSAVGHRHPSLAVYASRPGLTDRPTVVAYRDQLRFSGQTPLDAEVASDKSYLASSLWSFKRVDFEASYRRNMTPVVTTDRAISASASLWRGFSLTAGRFETTDDSGSSDWRTIAVHVPLSHGVTVSFERAFVHTDTENTTTSAVMGSVAAGRLQLFHRYQWGEASALDDSASNIARQQIQSMASYRPGSRVNFSLQLATDWTALGRPQHWEELQTSIAVTRRTSLLLVTEVPDVTNRERLRARLVQQLPHDFSIEAEFGRLSAFQNVPDPIDRSRAKIMVRRSWNIATPASGGELIGRVIDQGGHPVAGARVTLGDWSVKSDAGGAYRFEHLPRGEYPLRIDDAFLPADYAWDGRETWIAMTGSTHATRELRVAPLNAIHGRVYCDRNGNGRYDEGEGVANAVLRLGDRVTATDPDGGYTFFNVWPGLYTLRLDAGKLGADYAASTVERDVELQDGHPVTGADFVVIAKAKPIIWKQVIK